MKDLYETNFIFRMEIKRDRVATKLWLNQRKHIEIVLECFNMQYSSPIKVPIPMGSNIIIE
jgi:hypothetical protein